MTQPLVIHSWKGPRVSRISFIGNLTLTVTPVGPLNAIPVDARDWQRQREEWTKALMIKSFGAWPTQPEDLDLEEAFSSEQDGLLLRANGGCLPGPTALVEDCEHCTSSSLACALAAFL